MTVTTARRAQPTTAQRLADARAWILRAIRSVAQLPPATIGTRLHRNIPPDLQPVADQALVNFAASGGHFLRAGEDITDLVLWEANQINRDYDRLTATPRRRQDH